MLHAVLGRVKYSKIQQTTHHNIRRSTATQRTGTDRRTPYRDSMKLQTAPKRFQAFVGGCFRRRTGIDMMGGDGIGGLTDG